MRLGAAVGTFDIHSFHGRSSPLYQNRMAEWLEVRADCIIQLSQSALMWIIYRPDQVGLERRFKGVLIQHPRALGGIDLLACDGLKAVDAHQSDLATVVGGQQPTLLAVLTSVSAGSAWDEKRVAPVPPAGSQKIVHAV